MDDFGSYLLADCACTWDRHRARRYGSYGASVEPGFDQLILPYLDRGMIYAIAHVRGGGEMGRYWCDRSHASLALTNTCIAPPSRILLDLPVTGTRSRANTSPSATRSKISLYAPSTWFDFV